MQYPYDDQPQHIPILSKQSPQKELKRLEIKKYFETQIVALRAIQHIVMNHMNSFLASLKLKTQQTPIEVGEQR